MHVRRGFAFQGHKIKRGSRGLRLPAAKIRSGVQRGNLYLYPTQTAVDRLKDTIRRKTQRRIPLHTAARPAPAAPAGVPSPKAQRNFTDPDSRIMPASDAKGSFFQGYNAQVAVDAHAQIIVAADVTHEPNDKQHAQPLMTAVLAQTGQVPRVASLDAGYFSEANVEAIATLGCEPLIPPDRQSHGRPMPAAPQGRPPAGLSVADRMRRTLRTKRGRRLYARRKAIVEPVLGQIKQGRGFRQFLLRGLQQVRGEWPDLYHPQYPQAVWTALRRCRRRPGERLRVPGGSRKAKRRA